MYHPYQQHQQQSQGYQEYPGYYAPEPHQSQGPPAANPFVAPPGPKRAPPRRNRKKRTTPMQPVVPQPGTAPAPAKPVDQADEQLEWVLVPKGTPATTPSNTVTTPPAEPEPKKVSVSWLTLRVTSIKFSGL